VEKYNVCGEGFYFCIKSESWFLIFDYTSRIFLCLSSLPLTSFTGKESIVDYVVVKNEISLSLNPCLG